MVHLVYQSLVLRISLAANCGFPENAARAQYLAIEQRHFDDPQSPFPIFPRHDSVYSSLLTKRWLW